MFSSMTEELRTVPCDRCGEPVVPGVDLVYTVADRFDDDGNLVLARHGRCQPSRRETTERLTLDLERIDSRVRELTRLLRK